MNVYVSEFALVRSITVHTERLNFCVKMMMIFWYQQVSLTGSPLVRPENLLSALTSQHSLLFFSLLGFLLVLIVQRTECRRYGHLSGWYFYAGTQIEYMIKQFTTHHGISMGFECRLNLNPFYDG